MPRRVFRTNIPQQRLNADEILAAYALRLVGHMYAEDAGLDI